MSVGGGGSPGDSPRLPVNAVWTDFAGVLTPPLAETMAVFCARVRIPAEALLPAVHQVARAYGTDDIMLPVDTPLVTEEQWLREIEDALPAEHRGRLPAGTIAGHWFADREPNRAWVAQLRQLRARGLFVGMISNMMPSWGAYWRRMVPADDLFDDVILSCDVGHRKPQHEIFALAAARAAATPGECLLIDDTVANCAAARAAGWTAVHFLDTTDAVEAVETILAGRQPNLPPAGTARRAGAAR